MERRARKFSRGYGAGLGWSDDQINRALADHGYPDLRMMPPHDTSTAARQRLATYHPETSPTRSGETAIERHRWQRTNAMHLLGHIIAEHADPRCAACSDWFPLTEAEIARGKQAEGEA